MQPYKKGPDYIDPMWLTQAAGRVCRNLDFHMMGEERILSSFTTFAKGAAIAVIEGNLGLFDGVDIEGADSTAGLSRLLEAPVILVVDSSRMNRGIAPLLHGYRTFDPEIQIAGVILNKVGNPRHESKLRRAIERYVGLEILGAIPKGSEDMVVRERHLGLVPTKENSKHLEKIRVIGKIIEENVNMERLFEIARSAEPMPEVPPCKMEVGSKSVTIGVAMDQAFTFYYPENLEALEAAGARLVYFSPLADERLPEVDGLYLGGGFPEIYMEALDNNSALRGQIKTGVEEGMPVYAECGGLMYLTRSITWKGKTKKMVGALPCDVEMTVKPAGMGYVSLEATNACGWFKPETVVKCHEFHHSSLVNIDSDFNYAWKVLRGVGITGDRDGIVYKNVMASYAHLHHCGYPDWAKNFVAHVKRVGRSATLPVNEAGFPL